MGKVPLIKFSVDIDWQGWPWEGSEEGLTLDWHFEKLKDSGFGAVDCFWRCDCDAVYGGIRRPA